MGLVPKRCSQVIAQLYNNRRIAVVIPALNEEESIDKVIGDLPGYVDQLVVVDNGSTDRTADRARAAGAEVVLQPERGYGAACLKGIEQLSDDTDIIVFLDGDYSDYPQEMIRLLDPIVYDDYEVVIGSRMSSGTSRKALPPVARFGNRLSTTLIRWFWGYRFTDLGPFRAVTVPAYRRLDMSDPDFGWTVELQIKAARLGMRATEVPVSYRPRIGRSKISGTIVGSFRAGTKILYLIFRQWLAR